MDPTLGLLNTTALIELAQVVGSGAKKYYIDDWRLYWVYLHILRGHALLHILEFNIEPHKERVGRKGVCSVYGSGPARG